jgi:hypothetical protein
MPLRSLTVEKVRDLRGKCDALERQLAELKATSPEDMWLGELDEVEGEYKKSFRTKT